MTPNEMGLQEIRRVLKIEPNSGVLEAFKKGCLNVGFKTRISEDQRIWVNNFAMSAMETSENKDSEFKYTSKKIN
jgi:hypothetical protein